MPPGRLTLYTEEIAEEICQRIGEGETLSQVCRSEHLPERRTVVDWVLQNREGFSARYATARNLQMERWADEVVDIADDGGNDYMEREKGEGRTETEYNGDHVQRSRLRIDSRKWLLSKLKPQQYGERQQIDHTHKVEVSALSDEELANIAAGGSEGASET